MLLSQLRVQLMRIYVYPAGLRGTDTVPKIEKRILQSSLTGRLDCSFFRTHSKFYKISKYTEKLQKIACSDVPVFRHIFLRHKNFVCHIPIKGLRIWLNSKKLRSRRHADNVKCLTE